MIMQGARRALSQDLVALWVDEFGPALALLRRIFPPGLMRHLSVKKTSPPPLRLPSLTQQSQVCCCTLHITNYQKLFAYS